MAITNTTAPEAQVLQDLFKNASSRKHQKGQIIIYQGDVIQHFFFVKSGFLRVYTITQSGDERTLLILVPGDIFPLLKDPGQTNFESLYFYETMEAAELCTMNRPELLDKIRHEHNAAWAMFHYISEFSNTLTNRIALLESKSAQDKVVQLLDYLISVCGKPMNASSYLLQLKLTQQEIANLVGHTRETVSILINKLEKQKVISYHRGYLVVHKSQLDRHNTIE